MADSEPGGEVARNELRASHEDRDRVVELLRVSAGDGRLTADELDERLELAMTARTYGELAQLVADLPADGSVASAPARPAPQAKDVVRLDTGSGHTVRNGPWIVPQRIEARVRSGHLKLDFTEAVITQRTLHLDAEVRSGHVILITKPGIVVDTDDVVVRSGHVRVRAPWGPDVPEVLRIEVTGKVGSGHFIARPKYRTFWQWLTRQPRPYEIAAR
jgi:hypothetical protein